MTHRTETSTPTPIEIATQQVVESISGAAASYHATNAVFDKQNITLSQFKRIVALYFEHMTLREWCAALNIPDATDRER